MKTKQLLTALAAGTFCLSLAMQARAQDPIVQIANAYNASLDYMPSTNEYLLSGGVAPVTIGGMSNASTSSYLPRIQLQVVDDATLGTTLYKTYCTNFEISQVRDAICSNLSVAFQQSNAKQTPSGNFLLCGYVERTSEYSSCPGPTYCNPYLLKTDASGAVLWYKRYDAGYNNRTRFYSVVEDPATGNVVVCGETTPAYGVLPTAFVMGTDAMGNLLWSKYMTTTQWGSTTVTNSTFTEITPFTDGLGNQHLVMTGPVGYGSYYGYGINTGGGMLTVVDGNGTILNNNYLSEDPFSRFMQLQGVRDAHDGEVVLTGFSGGNNCGAHDGFNVMVMKINPMMASATPSFMNVYQTNTTNMYDISYGESVVADNSGAPSGTIAVTGYQNAGFSGSNFGVYLETDYLGNWTRYTQHNSTNTTEGKGMIYNTTNGHSVYSGFCPGGTFIIKDNYGFSCDSDIPPTQSSLNCVHVPNVATNIPVTTIPEALVDFNLSTTNTLACGMYKPAGTTKQSVQAVQKITLSPNPAAFYIDIQLPADMKGGNVKVYDMTGREVLAPKNNADDILHVSVATLASGMYMLIVENNGAKQHVNFVKN